MCDPVSIAAISGGMAIGQQVLQYKGQQDAFSQNVDAANKNYAYRLGSVEAQRAQLDEKQSETKFDQAIKAAQTEGAVVNSATTSGLAPSSLVHALNTADFGLARDTSVADINDRNARLQLAQDQTGAKIERQAQINRVASPNPLSLILGIGKAGADAGASYYQMTG